MTQKDWTDYYKNTQSKPASKLLVRALPYVIHNSNALDIGAGGLTDSVHLLNLGFSVSAIDSSPLIIDFSNKINNEKLSVHHSSFENFDFPVDSFDIASAMYALPFTDKLKFKIVFNNIKQSLKVGGIFCGQFFGPKDEWSQNPKMTFHGEVEIRSLLNDFQIILIEEIERDGKKADGSPKHWHYFNVIAKKL